MQTKTIKISKINRDFIVSKYKLFQWELIEEKVNPFSVTLTFSRNEEDIPYIKELNKLEFNYKEYKYTSFAYVIALVSIAFICFTTFLILFLANKEDFSKIMWSISLIILGALSLLGAVLILFSRNKVTEFISTQKPKIDREIKEKINALKEEYKK